MIVTVRCLSSLAGVQPASPQMEFPSGALLSDVYQRLGLPPDADVVAIIDGGPANPGTPLKDGAVIELVPMVEGG
ncbi:MAG: MoaD/ThiS family protein [Acidobacteriota bacterium]